jgi:clathrin heavy chain
VRNGEFRLAQVCGLNLVIHADELGVTHFSFYGILLTRF